MDIVEIIESRMQPRGVSDGAYLAASKDTGVVYLGDVKNTDSGQQFIRYQEYAYEDGTSEADRICEPLSDYILISKVEGKEYGC